MSEWRRTVNTGRRDLSEPAVVDAFREGGATVVKHSGKDEPDLFVGFAGAWRPVETKTSNGKLTPGQLRWWREVAKAEPVVARTPAQAKKWLAVWRERRPTLGTVRAEHEAGGGNWAIPEDVDREDRERLLRCKSEDAPA
jgi:hypothetical protein